jgi:hypothetical protein
MISALKLPAFKFLSIRKLGKTSPRHADLSRSLRTYRSPYREIENPLRNQCSRWISVARGAPRYLAKVRRFASRKAIQNQPLTSSVLNPGSRELWRKPSKRQNFGSRPVRRSAEVCVRTPVFIEYFCAVASGRRMLRADRLAEGEELESNILRVLLRKSANYCEADRRQKCGVHGASSRAEARVHSESRCSSRLLFPFGPARYRQSARAGQAQHRDHCRAAACRKKIASGNFHGLLLSSVLRSAFRAFLRSGIEVAASQR